MRRNHSPDFLPHFPQTLAFSPSLIGELFLLFARGGSWLLEQVKDRIEASIDWILSLVAHVVDYRRSNDSHNDAH
jgi:hypothetical protein